MARYSNMGFGYESPLNQLLDKTIPQVLGMVLEDKQRNKVFQEQKKRYEEEKAFRDKEFEYQKVQTEENKRLGWAKDMLDSMDDLEPETARRALDAMTIIDDPYIKQTWAVKSAAVDQKIADKNAFTASFNAVAEASEATPERKRLAMQYAGKGIEFHDSAFKMLAPRLTQQQTFELSATTAALEQLYKLQGQGLDDEQNDEIDKRIVSLQSQAKALFNPSYDLAVKAMNKIRPDAIVSTKNVAIMLESYTAEQLKRIIATGQIPTQAKAKEEVSVVPNQKTKRLVSMGLSVPGPKSDEELAMESDITKREPGLFERLSQSGVIRKGAVLHKEPGATYKDKGKYVDAIFRNAKKELVQTQYDRYSVYHRARFAGWSPSSSPEDLDKKENLILAQLKELAETAPEKQKKRILEYISQYKVGQKRS